MPRLALGIGCVALVISFALRPGAPLLAAGETAHPITSVPRLSSELNGALQDRKFAEAIQFIDDELKKPSAAHADYLLYLRGRAQAELKLYDQAIETLHRLQSEHPKSEWLSRARFGQAEVLMRQRNYQQAGEIYEREATRLLSAGRRDELAAIYLEFADRFFDGVANPSEPAQKTHDYGQAAEFYQQAASLHPGLEKRQQIELRIARCRQELKQLPQAIEEYRKFIADYGSDADVKNRAPVKLEIEARYRLGLALLDASQPADARKTWQDLLESPAFRLDGNDFLAEAQFQLGRTYGIPAPASEGDLELGVAALGAFLKEHPKHRLAPEAELDIAMSYGSRGRFEQAAERLKSLIGNPDYASSEELPKARNLLGEILFSQKKYDEAVRVWRAFLSAHPNHRAWNAVLSRITDAEFEKAQEQYRLKNYKVARELWEAFLKDHPLDTRVPKALYLFGKMKYQDAVDRVNERLAEAAKTGKTIDAVDATARQLFEQAIDEWKRLVSKYPDSEDPTHNSAYLAIGEVFEMQLGRLNDAIEAYKKADAQDRITRLTQRQMEILTPRKFRTHERPFLHLSTRNVDKVNVKVYPVEMTDYFRKMHLAGAIETLDIGLIDPDKTFEFAVKGFEKLRPFENDVPLPVQGPGVWAVTVSSEKLEATTMVIVSDLDVIVKCSRNELFVFAENVAEKKPADGTKLLISDGARIFAEETTGKDGVFQKSYEELKSVSDLRVFAVRGGHAASTVNRLEGLDFAVGLTPIGHLDTDRPAYRAGELVNLKGIVRWVANDRFTFKEGEAFELDVADPRGRTVHTAHIKLDRFGCFAASFILPETVPQGTCSIHLHQPNGKQSYSAQFEVHEAKLEQIRLEVDLPRKVYYRGEKIQGKIRLRYYYGTPLAGRVVQYRLADDRLQTGTTDAAGELAFELPTRRYSESQTLSLDVLEPEHNLRTVERIFLSARGFAIQVATVRKVYLSGETFDASMTVTDAAGQPAGVGLKLEILERMAASGQSGERLVASHEIKSDKQTGQAHETVHIDKSGRYVLRATAVDRFGTPVSGSEEIAISGDDDSVRLRILADRHDFQAGDTAHVQLHWRQAPALALVTYEGASILEYKLVDLKTGANPFNLALEPRLAPNFVLAVAVIDGTVLHHASSDFSISRKLRISLKPDRSAVKPGDAVRFEITATDPQGKPVSAEISLAMVQRNLLDLFAGKGVTVDQVFSRGQRKPSMSTLASCSFLYMPVTHAISDALLSEEERAKIAAREAKSLERIDLEYLAENAIQLRLAGKEEGSLDSFVDVYKTLMSAGRYSEAEAVADRAKSLDPSNRAAIAMLEGARRAKGQKGEMSSARDAIEQLYEVNGADEPAASQNWSFIQSRGIDFEGPGSGKFVGKAKNMRGLGGGGRETPAESETMRDATVKNKALRSENPSLGKFGSPVFDSSRGYFKGGLDDKDKDRGTDKSKAPDDGVFIRNGGPPQVRNGESWFAQDARGVTFPFPLNIPNTSRSETGLRLLAEAVLGETGYWNPAVVTNAAGKASVTFRLPERATAWRVRAAGIDVESLAGEATLDLVAKKDFFGEMKLPAAFTAGDRAEVLVDVQNASVASGEKIDLRLKLTLNDRTTELKKSLVSQGPGMQSVSFPAALGEAGTADLELTVESGNRRDVTRKSVPVHPDGLATYATASGTAGQSTVAFIAADSRVPMEHPQLEILIGPSVDRTLLEAILGAGFEPRGCERVLPTNALEKATSDILGGLGLIAMVRTSRTTETPEVTALATRVRAAVAQLVSAQRDDGGWSWSGGGQAAQSDRFLSSRAAWALAAARRAGFAVPGTALEKAIAWLSTALASARPSERDAQAVLFHALAECGKGDFAIGNRLYRDRNHLSAPSLLHVALALARLDRKEMAGELLGLVKIDVERGRAAQAGDDASTLKAAPVIRSGVEMRALYLLALEEIQPTSEKLPKLVDWLLAARSGSHWLPEKANGIAVAALARWYSQVKATNEKYALAIYVNDHLLKKLSIDPAQDSSSRLEVPAAMLVQGRPQRINFDLEGRARFSYSAILSGFVPSNRLVSTTDGWTVGRTYEPAERMLDGETIPRGFDILSGSYTTFRNDLTQLPVGARGEVTLHVFRRHLRGTADEPLDYLVLTEPLPAGASVLADSVRGSFERYEISAGSITFYLGDVANPGPLSYTLVGYVPGSFHVAPTVIRSFYQPQRIAVSTAKSLDVLAKGAVSRDEYKLTPRELFEFGKRLVAKGKFAEGADYLTRLLKQYHLQDAPYRETVQALFQAALATGQDPSIVENFEIIKEKLPDVEIDFPSILRVALAYRALGEYERSFLVYRATIEAVFQRESQIAGFLDDRGQFQRSLQVMERLLREYPAESYVATATYALAQEVSGKAPSASTNDELRNAGLTRVDLIAASINMLDHFVATWPNDPAADQATFSAVSAFLDLEKYEAAVARSRRAIARYPDSGLADSFWYVIGYSQYELGQSDDALAICRKVAEMMHKDPRSGELVPAENKWQAVYITGQIFHSLGKPTEALAAYERVQDKFPDAHEAIDYFVHRRLSLPEVVTLRPNQAPQVTLTYRNIPRIDLKVYRVDLLKFGLLQRNLAKIAAINLAGIRPYHELSLDLGNGKDYRDREKTLSLPLKDEGAYLLVCRGGDDYASGLVLVSPLELAVQEEAASGRVRVTARNVIADRYAGKVLVKVIGSENADFVSGETDLRGLFKADAIRGTTTVIARADTSRYAFFRGTTKLRSPPPQAPAAKPDDERAQQAAPAPKAPNSLLENLERSNSGVQQQQRESYRNLLRNKKQGVKAQDAF
jgi:alpha-2-macroglobulin